jgi:hypothetical protein
MTARVATDSRLNYNGSKIARCDEVAGARKARSERDHEGKAKLWMRLTGAHAPAASPVEVVTGRPISEIRRER